VPTTFRHRVDELAPDCTTDDEIVDHAGRAGAHALDRADHRAEIYLPWGQGHRHGRAHVQLPELEGQVFGAAALEVLV